MKIHKADIWRAFQLLVLMLAAWVGGIEWSHWYERRDAFHVLTLSILAGLAVALLACLLVCAKDQDPVE